MVYHPSTKRVVFLHISDIKFDENRTFQDYKLNEGSLPTMSLSQNPTYSTNGEFTFVESKNKKKKENKQKKEKKKQNINKYEMLFDSDSENEENEKQNEVFQENKEVNRENIEEKSKLIDNEVIEINKEDITENSNTETCEKEDILTLLENEIENNVLNDLNSSLEEEEVNIIDEKPFTQTKTQVTTKSGRTASQFKINEELNFTVATEENSDKNT